MNARNQEVVVVRTPRRSYLMRFLRRAARLYRLIDWASWPRSGKPQAIPGAVYDLVIVGLFIVMSGILYLT